MDGSKIESGLQLFSRLSQRPSLNGLSPCIFYEGGPHPNEFIEVTGDSEMGKALMITDFLARCLLPQQHKGIALPGQNCGAIIIDTNHHFNVLKLIDVMEALIRESCDKFVKISLPTLEEIIKSCLTNLIILNCYDSQQLHMTFLNLERILSENGNISLIVLDSVSAYYWEYRNTNGIIGMATYHTKVLESLENCIRNLNVSVVYTKVEADTKTSKEMTTKYETYKIIIKEHEDKFMVHIIYSIKNIHRTVFYIFDRVIKFMNNEN